MGQFSEDCQWWWDGQSWIPTSQVVVPQLPPTEIELSGQLALGRARLAKGRPEFWWQTLLLSAVWLSAVNRRGVREYRTWTIEQLSLAVAYLLGAEEPLLAGEMSRYDVWDGWARNRAIAVTAAHVIVFRIDHLDGQPRWIAMAARVTDVSMRRRSILFGLGHQWLEVTGPTGRWTIMGFAGDEDFNPEPVIEAWRSAFNSSLGTR